MPNQLKIGAALNYVIVGLNIILGLCYTPYMLRCLGQNEYGLYSLVASIIAYLTLLDFGFGPTIIRYTAKYRAEGKIKEQFSLFGLSIVLYSIIGLIAFLGGLILYFNIDVLFDRTMTPEDIRQAKVMILLLLLNLAITFPFSVFGSIIQAYEKFIFQKSVLILRLIFSTLTIICLLYMGYKAVAMVIVQTVFNIALLGINCWYCFKRLHIKLIFKKFDATFVKQLLSFSIWVFLGELMFKFYYSTGQFVLGATSGTVQIAVFSLAVTFMQMYMLFSGGISGVLLPKLSAMTALHKSDHEVADLFIRVGRLQYFILVLILSGFIIFGNSFIAFWAGPGYNEVYYIALIFFFSTLIPLIQNTAISILMARNQQKFRSLMLVVVGASSLILQIILSKKYGALGCGIAVGFANLIGQGLILNIYYHQRQHLEISRFWKEIIKMSIVPFLLTSIGYIIYNYFEFYTFKSLIICILIYCIIFIPLMFRFSLNKSERDIIINPLSTLRKRLFK